MRNPDPMHGPRAPMMLAALAFSAGVVLERLAWRPPALLLVAAIVLILGSLFFRPRHPLAALALSLTALAPLGMLAAQAQWAAKAANLHEGNVSRFIDEDDVTVTAWVSGDPLAQGALRERRQVLDLQVEEIATPSGATRVSAGMRANVYWRDGGEEDEGADITGGPGFSYGQRLRFPAKLRPPRNFGNPGAWDYRQYLEDRGITVLATVRGDRIEVLPGTGGSRYGMWRSRARRSVLKKVHELWNPERAALQDAMLIGETAFIDREIKTDFQRSGTYHVLVVSGMNVSILAFAIFWLARKLRIGEAAASLATVMLAAGYAYIADAGAPIVRAALMLTVYLFARLLYRQRSQLNAVGSAALVALVADPHALFDAGFQLTFLAVFTIGAIAAPMLERTSGPYRSALRNLESPSYDLSMKPEQAQFRLDLRMLAERMARFIGQRFRMTAVRVPISAGLAVFDIVVVSAIMQIALAPPMAVYFHRATLTSLGANVLVLPLAGVQMPMSALALGLSYVSLTVAKVPAMIAGWSVDGISGSVELFGRLRVADHRVATPALALCLFAACALAVAALTARRRRVLAVAGLAVLAASGAWIALLPPRPQVRAGALEVTTIDVGQAESTLVVTPDGHTLLVDTGGMIGPVRSAFDLGEDVVSPYLWSRGITRLDAVAITHGHSDHIGGLPSVLANFRPSEFWIGPTNAAGPMPALMRRASELNASVIGRRCGERFRFGEAEFEVISPPAGYQPGPKPKNNDSMVLRIQYGATAAILEGDAEKQMERQMARLTPRADLLKVAHNGSTTSTIPEFLAAVKPSYAVIFVGARNLFHHPRAEVLERLEEARVHTFRTDTAGAVTFYLDGKRVTALPSVAPPDR